MQHTERKALETYKENMIYFEKNHKELYEKLMLMESVISNGQYAEKFALEYKENGFDVLEIASGAYLYDQNSTEHTKEITDAVDFSRSNGIFEAQRFVDFSPEMPDIIDKSELHFNNGLWATVKIIEYAKKVAPRHASNMKSVYKMLFLGVGLGLHIPAIIKKMGSKVVFIKENNLELFRLSLFVTNYGRLSKQVQIFFSVMEDEHKLKQNFLRFLQTGNNYNLYLKQISLTKMYEDELFGLQNIVMNQEYIMYPYSAFLLRYIDSPKYILQNYPFLNLSRRYNNHSLSNKPFLFLLSGPSTANNVEWIRKNQENFVIVSALSACRYLSKNGIQVDVVVHIDPEEHTCMLLLEGIDPAYFENVITILASNLHSRMVKSFNPKNVYFIQQDGNYKYGFGAFSAPSVGEFIYGVFLIFGIKQLYFLGIDMALDPETMASHSPDHPLAHIAEAGREETGSLELALVYVPGNFLPEVPTYPMYTISIGEFSRFSGLFKQADQNVYNLSNGALLEGAEPLKIESLETSQLPVLDKQTLHTEIQTFFHSISSSQFTEEDETFMRYQLKEAKKLKSVIDQYKKQTFIMPSLYIDGLNKLQWNLCDMENKTHSNLAHVYYLYFLVVFSYICEIFNTDGLTDVKEHIKAVNTILIAQLEKLGNTYIDRMESYLEGR